MKLFIFVCCLCIKLRTSLSDDVSTPHQCLAAPSEKCFTVIVEQKLTWNDAEKYCEKNLPNGRLASIHNAFEGSAIAAWLPFLTTDPWIGAYQIGSLPFQWTDASSLDYSNWAPGQPTGLCAQICHSTASNAGIQCQQGKWRTSDCDTSVSQIICEYGNYSSGAQPTIVERSCNSNSGKCFALVIGTAEWSEAETFCRSQTQNGTVATLASITSRSDSDIVATFLQYPSLKSNLWIGAFAFNGPPFLWTDKSSFSFTNWAPGQPPENPDGCVQVCLKADSNCVPGKWTVVPCTTKQSFICENLPHTTDCADLHETNHDLPSGIYNITLPGVPTFSVYCEMDTDGGGWTVFQRRVDSSVSFYDKNWNEYKNGFNNGLTNNLWLGNDKIHILSTKDSNVELRIDIWGDRAPGSALANGYWFGKYSSFWIADEAHYYALNLANTSIGNATISGSTDGINYNNGANFSTADAQHDPSPTSGSCVPYSTYQPGGWWLNACTYSSLNGKYIPAQWQRFYGFCWEIAPKPNGYTYINPAQSRMMLRKIIS